MPKNIVIVGAGIAGLSVAYQLNKHGIKTTILEKDSHIGGLAKSFHYKKFDPTGQENQ